jgi:hypothetical protein
LAWQPALLLAQSCGAIRATELSSLVADELTEMTIEPAAIASRIAWAAEYTNDARWCEVLARQAVPELGVLGLLDRAPDPAGCRRLVEVEDAGLIEAGQHEADRRFQIRCLQSARAISGRCLVAVLECGAERPRFVDRDLVRALDPVWRGDPDEAGGVVSEGRERHEVGQRRGGGVTPEIELFGWRLLELDLDPAVREPCGRSE